MIERMRARLKPKVDADPGVLEVEQLMDDIIAAHNEQHHPGFGCAENERGQCVDAFGGTRVAGSLGEYARLT